VKAGTILPMQPPVEYTGQKPLDPLLVTVFPLADKQSDEYRLYEDSGEGLGYLEGQSAWTTIRAERAGAGTTVTIAPVEGSYPGMAARRGYEVRLPGSWPPEAVKVNGAAASWSFEGNTLTTVVRVPAQSTAKAVRIEVRVSPAAAGRDALLDGFAGKIQRLREAYGALNTLTRQHVWSPDPLIDAWQTGDRLTYHPQTAAAELERFAEALRKAVAAVEKLRTDHPDAAIAPVLQVLNDLR
jgi:alpha-glucosidase